MTAIGVQRLAQRPDRDEVLRYALASGVRALDTADVYGGATGAAERWLAGVAADVWTKGGLRLEGTRMIPDGRPTRLIDAAEASRDRLQVDALARWQWHAPDPRVDPGTSIRAIGRILDRRVAREVGLCNVTVGVLRRALDAWPVASVQVELSPLRPRSFRSGVVEEALSRGIPVLAYRPLGGPDGVRALRRDKELAEVAAALGWPVEAVVLAWLRSLGVVPLSGPTRADHVDRAREAPILPDEVRARLDARFEPGLLRTPRASRARRGGDGEVVVVMGIPGAGKSTRLARYPEHLRLNRDLRGGTLDQLAEELDRALAAGHRRVVLDNTYASRASRRPVLEAAWRHGLPVRCEWLDTPVDDAEVNVIHRILDLVGELPEPAVLAKAEPVGLIPPRALSRYREEFEPPEVDEGFAEVARVPFARRPPTGSRPMALMDPRDLTEANTARLRAWADQGFALVSVGWEPARDEAQRAAILARTVERGAALGLAVHAWSCPHPAGPPVCWCRKPLPGLVVRAMRELGVDPARSVALGTNPADRAVARKVGIADR